jgi:amidohydrolase
MLNKAQNIASQLIDWRRDFHRHPELGFQEKRTAARVAQVLEGLGYRVRAGVGKTGVVADLGQGAPRVAIRADMDALPILEANETPYASTMPGVMHACGHDAHTAMVLGVATLLAPEIAKDENLHGSVRMLFQPSEEANDSEGISGAPRMIHDGAMDGVDAVLALHVDPLTPVGDIRIAAGPFSGGVDSFFATIYGKGGHGAWPHATIDPIYLSSLVILALHGIVSRRLDPFAPAVVTIGSLCGGQAENVIPDRVELSGTIRFLERQVQGQIHTEIERALQIARTLGGDYQLKIVKGTPPMHNDEGVVQTIRQAAADLLGVEHIFPPLDSLGAEDFGCFSEIAPGAMFSLGCGFIGERHMLHNPHFDLDEGCLPIGAAILAETALRLLRIS